MPKITDVSPRANANTADGQYPNGRMLSLACSSDGQTVFAGSLSSNIWISRDAGKNFEQLTWPQPEPDQFGVPGAIGGFCVTSIAVSPEAGHWRVDRNPRLVGDLTGDGRADIVGFGDDGVWTALGNGDGTFQPPQLVLNGFGYVAGGWRVEKHPRFLADLTGTGKADIVGFGEDGVADPADA